MPDWLIAVLKPAGVVIVRLTPVEHTIINKLPAVGVAANNAVTLEEVVEVFVQANTAIPNYIELEVNPLGTMLDIYLIDTRKPLHYESWNSEKMQWAVHVDGIVDGKEGDREWTCEIALPLEDVATATRLPPQPGDRWRVNLYRVERLPDVAELAWSPTLQDDFHVLPRMGEIIFTGRRVPKK